MVILQVISILLNSLSLAIFIVSTHISIFLHYSIWYFIISIIATIILWGASFFILNRKAKIFSLIIGVILGVLFIILKNIFFSQVETVQNTISGLQESETTLNTISAPQEVEKNGETTLLDLEKIDESIFELEKMEYKKISKLSDEQCKKFNELISFFKEQPNIHQKSHTKTKFLQENESSLLGKLENHQKIKGEMENIIRDTLSQEINNNKDIFNIEMKDIFQKMSDISKTKYENLKEQKEDIINEIKKLQNSEQAKKEKSKIFTDEYLSKYRDFLLFINENNKRNFSKITCDKNLSDTEYLSRMRILGNHLILSAIYNNNAYIQDSINISAEFLEHQKEKYNERKYFVGPTGLNLIMTNIALYSINNTSLDLYATFSKTKKDFSKMIATLETYNEKSEYLVAIKKEYWNIKNHIGDPMKNPELNELFQDLNIDPSNEKQQEQARTFYNQEETNNLIKHLYVALLREIDSNIQKFSYNNKYQGEPLQDFYDLLIKKGKVDPNHENNKLSNILKINSIPNYTGRMLVFAIIPSITGYKERYVIGKITKKKYT